METHVTGQPVLGALRQRVLLPLLGHPLFSEAEQLRAKHFVHECEGVARLTHWGANGLAETARCEAAAARQHRDRAPRTTLRQLQAARFRPRQPTPGWGPGAFFSDRSDRWAGTFDRLAAASFQPADARTFDHLRSRPSR